MKKSRLTYLLMFVSVMLMILHPYTLYGKPGIVMVLLFAVSALRHGQTLDFFRIYLLPCLLLLAIALVGALSSLFHGIPQANHPMAVVSLLIMILAARGVYLACERAGIGFHALLKIVLASIVINSAIVLLEVQFDPLRQAIEMHLDQLTASSINYAEGFRLRGIATSGGASLSLTIPAALIIALYLFDEGALSAPTLAVTTVILLASVVVIGRSGIVLLVVPLAGYLMLMFARGRDLASLSRKVLGVVLVGALLAPLFYELILAFFTDMFGEAFITYAFGFLLEGGDGIRDEGTVDAVAGFLTVLPLQWPEALVGYGFYGGSEFYPWTDSGYSRTFLSVGFVLGLCFYAILLRMFLLGTGRYRFLLGSFVLLLLIAEAKEPLLYSGVASRMFILIAVFAYSMHSRKQSDVLKPGWAADAPARNAA